MELACSLQATKVAKHRTIGCELAFDLMFVFCSTMTRLESYVDTSEIICRYKDVNLSLGF